MMVRNRSLYEFKPRHYQPIGLFQCTDEELLLVADKVMENRLEKARHPTQYETDLKQAMEDLNKEFPGFHD